MSAKTLPGFLLTIEDNMKPTIETPAIKDVYVIYAVLPELMKYKDEDGNIYDKFIEPNKPLLIATGGREDAVTTLELSDLELTREVRNILTLLPGDSTIALCRIVTRDGEQPDTSDLISMHEALDFAFEMTENYPMKQIIVADMSLDKSVALVPNEFSCKTVSEETIPFAELEVKALFENIKTYNGGTNLVNSKNATVSVSIERAGTSLTESSGKGIFNKLTFNVNNKKAMITKEDGSLVPLEIEFDVNYDTPDVPVVNQATVPDGITASMTVIDQTLSVSITGTVNVVLDEEAVISFKGTNLTISDLGKDSAGNPNKKEIVLSLRKVSSTADILGRILKHNSVITATQNPCLTFMSPEPPRNGSTKAIGEYVDRVEALFDKIRDRAVSVNAAGNKVDLGMYLSVPVGVNRIDNIGGISGFGQSTIATIEANKIITQKVTSNFAIGDIVEVYTNNKLDIEMITAKVTGVSLSAAGTTEITLDKTVPENVTSTRSPKYIMNVNNKDFNGNYMAIQYANICKQVGVDRSPAGIAWPGECQVMFSESQKSRLNAKKFAVLMQRHGTVQGEIDKSQLMTGVQSQFQDFENIAVIYALVQGAKTIGMSYRGKRVNGTSDLALIKTEIEGTVFAPKVGRVIESGYDLQLFTKMLKAPNGKQEKAMFVNFAVTEIQTMKLLRMQARLN